MVPEMPRARDQFHTVTSSSCWFDQHRKDQPRWRLRKIFFRVAVLGIVGFILVLMTYVGVDYLNPRQHAFLLGEKMLVLFWSQP